MRKFKNHIAKDAFIIVISILLAVLMVKSNILASLFHATEGMRLLGSFFAGIFFTSAFTTPLAIAALGKLAETNSIVGVAAFGALGALLGDMIIFRFVKDSVAEDLEYLMTLSKKDGRMRWIFKLKLFRWISPFIGALIIASPLPDEIGIAILGLSRAKMVHFIPISYLMNFLGIYIIGAIATAV
jgi:hypothetical protein